MLPGAANFCRGMRIAHQSKKPFERVRRFLVAAFSTQDIPLVVQEHGIVGRDLETKVQIRKGCVVVTARFIKRRQVTTVFEWCDLDSFLCHLESLLMTAQSVQHIGAEVIGFAFAWLETDGAQNFAVGIDRIPSSNEIGRSNGEVRFGEIRIERKRALRRFLFQWKRDARVELIPGNRFAAVIRQAGPRGCVVGLNFGGLLEIRS